jgi:hypothetical protein
MAIEFLSSEDVVSDEQSFYNVMRVTGNGMTPFWESLTEGEPFEGNPKTGHIWYQTIGATTGEDNAHMEGSIRANIDKPVEVELRNHLQILKRTYGITKSEKAATSRVSKKALDRSKDNSILQLRLDVEKALLSTNAPVQRVDDTTAGKMGGVLHYISEVIDGAGTAALDFKLHIEAPLKTMFINGVLEDKVILCGTDMKSAINGFLDDKRQATNGENKINRNISEIEDTGWARNVKVTTSTNLAADEMLIYAPELINPIVLRQEKDNECSDPKYDAEAWENLFEMTVQVLDPYAAVHVKNLNV